MELCFCPQAMGYPLRKTATTARNQPRRGVILLDTTGRAELPEALGVQMIPTQSIEARPNLVLPLPRACLKQVINVNMQ